MTTTATGEFEEKWAQTVCEGEICVLLVYITVEIQNQVSSS